MSMQRQFSIVCDRCHREDDDNVDCWSATVREQAAQDGWKRIKGQDICPRCLEDREA